MQILFIEEWGTGIKRIIIKIIVDDELPALKMAESVLKAFDNIIITGIFQIKMNYWNQYLQ